MIHTEKHYPTSLLSERRWGLWKLEEVEGRITKVPYSGLYTGKASSTNPKTWCTFEEAVKKMISEPGAYKGLALFISPPLVFIDIDHALTDGDLDERALDILDALPDQYTEISQSGEGLHMIIKGEIPRSFKNSKNGIEIYGGSRFCAMTGNCISCSDPHECPSGLEYVYQRYKTPRPTESPHNAPREPLRTLDDKSIVQKASEQSEIFDKLYHSGSWRCFDYQSQSEADLALCLRLAFWTDRDREQMDRIFRSSGLFREKWCRSSYREPTLSRACAECDESISEYISRLRREEVEELERAYTEREHELFGNACQDPGSRSCE